MAAAHSSTHVSLSSFELSLDMTGPVTKTAGARQALAHLVSRTALLQETFGDTMPALGLNDNHLMSTANLGYQANPAAAAYDTSEPDQAKQLLTAAGYHQAADGSWIDAIGHPLVIRLAVETGDPWMPAVAVGIEDQLRAGGVTVAPFDVAGAAGMAAAAAFNAYDAAVVTRIASPFISETTGRTPRRSVLRA